MLVADVGRESCMVNRQQMRLSMQQRRFFNLHYYFVLELNTLLSSIKTTPVKKISRYAPSIVISAEPNV